MKELTTPGWIKLKGFLFLIIGFVAALLIILENPAVKTRILLVITIWCFCRFYYFAFYVIQHYVDDQYRFSGLWSFGRYLMTSKTKASRNSEREVRNEPPAKV